ncbi:MAG: PAS domain S-box protein, partial [Anaerolineales bacterium]
MIDHTLTNARILIVDDQETNNFLLESILELNGYLHYKSLTDPRQVLALYAEFQPDLILLDLMMPHLDGFAVMEGLRPLIPANTYFPILVLTADVTAETKRRALSSGATDFLTKPLDTVEVMLRIRNLLETRFLHLQLQNQNQILEQKVRERTAQLTESETKHRVLIEQIPAITYIDDPAGGPGEIQFVSQQVEELLGITPEEWIKGGYELWSQTIHADDRERVLADYQNHFESGESFECEYRLLTRDGRVVWIRDTARLLRDESGQPHLVHGIMFDITERVQAQAAQRESEEKYRQLVELAPDGILIHVDGIIVFANSAGARILGPAAPKDLIGKRLLDFVHPDYHQVVKDRVKQITENGQEVPSIEEKHVRLDGTVIDTEVKAIPFRYGNKNAVQVVINDITERKQAEEALRASQQIIEGIINAIPVSVFWKNKNLVYLGCNEVFARDKGFTDPMDVIGKDDYQLARRDQAELYRGDDRKIIESGRSKLLIEEPQTTPQGNTITLLTSKVPLRSSQGEIIGVLGTYMDITERKQAEAALARRAEELAALQATVLEITASHDLSSQLRTIVERATYLLQADGGGLYLCDPEQQEVRCVVSYNTIQDYTGTVLKYGEGTAGKVAQNGEALIIDDYRTWSGGADIYKKDQPFRTLVSVPMLWQGQVTGVLHVLRTLKDNPFTRADRDFLSLFANHAAIAVENTRLVDGLRLELKERKQAELELESQKEFAFQVMNTMGQGLNVTSAEGNFEYVNSTYARMLGYSSQQLMGRNPLEFTHLEDQAAQDQVWIQRTRGETTAYEVRLQRADGTTFPVSVTGVPRFQDGKFIGSIAVVTDLTERRESESLLRLQSTAMNAAANSIIVTDKQGVIQWVNPAFTILTGYSAK